MLEQFSTEEISKAVVSLEKSIKACRELYLETGDEHYSRQFTKHTTRIKELQAELLKREENHAGSDYSRAI